MNYLKKLWPVQIVSKDVWLLFFIVLLLNLDRLILGEVGFLRHLDVSDQYLNKMLFLSKFWLDPSNYSWDSSILRGWPVDIGSINPQYLGVLLAIFLPIQYIYPLLHIIIEFFIATGAYLFLFFLLKYSRNTAIFGSFLFLSINYWYNENPIVTAATLMPMLCVASSIGYIKLNYRLRILILFVITSLSYPPYVLPIMPLVHFGIIFIFIDRKKLWENFKYATYYWLIYIAFFSTSLLGFWESWPISNRAIWIAGFQTDTFSQSLYYFLTSKSTLFPAIIIFGLITKKTLKTTFFVFGLIFFILTLTAITNSTLADTIASKTILYKKFSFFFSRSYNFIGFIIFLLGSWLFENKLLRNEKINQREMMIFIIISLIFVLSYYYTSSFYPLGMAVIIAICILFTFIIFRFLMFRIPPKTYFLLIIVFVSLTPFRLYYSMTRENSYQGFLFTDYFDYNTKMKAFRVETLMNTYASKDIFSAQTLIKDIETFGGTSVYYDGSDAKYWNKFIALDEKSLGSKQFKYWNNRIELLAEDFEFNKDRIIKWLWLNNVVFIRSFTPINHQNLELLDKAQIQLVTKKSLLLRQKQKPKNQYLYKIKDPTTRLFSVIESSIFQDKSYVTDELEVDLFNNININNRENITLEDYTPGRLKFSSSFNNTEIIFSSINYNNRWELYIDGKLNQDRLSKGPFGMLQIDPLKGVHSYILSFKSSINKILLGIISSIVLSFLLFRTNKILF